MTIVKANFPENTFCYVNQGSVSLVKRGEKALYLDFIVLSQLMSATNVNPEIDLDSYILKGYYILHEVIIYCPVYNKSAGMYGGLTRKLGYITLRGDDREKFYSYCFNKEKCSLFCHMKTPLSNIFSCTAFKKHLPYLLDENQNKAKFSNMFFYFPSNLDRKEDFLKWKEHVHLHPIDLSFDDLTEITGNKKMNPSLLNNKDLGGEVVGAYYMLMKKIAGTSNQNLVQNSDAYISNGGKIDPDNEFPWTDDSYQSSKEKFQLSY